MRRTWLALVFVVFSGVAAGEEDQYVHRDTGLVFPGMLAGAHQTKVFDYGAPDLGVSIAYMFDELGMVNFYVYTGGHPAIPDGMNSDVVRNELERAAEDIRQAANQGVYAELELISRSGDTLGLDGNHADLWMITYTALHVPTGSQPVVSRLLITGTRGHFLKVRHTAPTSHSGEAGEALKDMLREFWDANATRPVTESMARSFVPHPPVNLLQLPRRTRAIAQRRSQHAIAE
jgi:hypothetical protein